MPVRIPRERKKPKLRRNDTVLLVTFQEGALSFPGKIGVVDNVANGKARIKGEDVDFDETGHAPGRRAIFLPQALRDSWARSPLLSDFSKLSEVNLNADALDYLDEENEKNA